MGFISNNNMFHSLDIEKLKKRVLSLLLCFAALADVVNPVLSTLCVNNKSFHQLRCWPIFPAHTMPTKIQASTLFLSMLVRLYLFIKPVEKKREQTTFYFLDHFIFLSPFFFFFIRYNV